ncbi:MAG: rane protein of unknown function [Patescibacteria group bacterium]|nr:rane protein of unknown function [Patescibacteria group bacterium]
MDLMILATFFVALFSSILSGISGGGGGFIMTPYFLLIGLSPLQNVAIGSVLGIGLSGSSLLVVRGRNLVSRRLLGPLVVITVVVTLLAMSVLPKVGAKSLTMMIGVLLLLLVPTLFVNKAAFLPGARSPRMVTLGHVLYGILLFGNALLSSGLAALLFLPLMFLMGLTALQANATKRVVGLVQAVLIFAILAPQGLIVWNHALAGLAGAWLGGHLGTHLAVKKGDRFVKAGLAVVMVLSGLALIFT